MNTPRMVSSIISNLPHHLRDGHRPGTVLSAGAHTASDAAFVTSTPCKRRRLQPQAFARAQAAVALDTEQDLGPVVVDGIPRVETAEPYLTETYQWQGNGIHYAVRVVEVTTQISACLALCKAIMQLCASVLCSAVRVKHIRPGRRWQGKASPCC